MLRPGPAQGGGLSLRHPFAAPAALFAAALLLRAVDVFALRLDERWGEIVLSKLLTIGLVLGYLYWTGRSVAAIGLHRRRIAAACAVAGVGMALALGLGFGAALAETRVVDGTGALALAAVDPKTGLEGGVLFGVWLVAGNVINAFAEEGLFRGVMLRHLLVRCSRWRALLLAAGLFAIWHLVWPLKGLVSGQTGPAEAAIQALTLGVATLVSGVVFGYFYLRTDSLWAPWLAHLINNTAFNVVFIGTGAGLRSPLESGVFGPVFLTALLLLIPWTAWQARRQALPEVRPWSPQPLNGA